MGVCIMSAKEKRLRLYSYKELDTKIKLLETIEKSLGDDIDTYMSMLEDNDENSTADDVRFIMLDLLVAVGRNTNLLMECIEGLGDINKRELKSSNSLDNNFNPYFDEKFKKQFAQWR